MNWRDYEKEVFRYFRVYYPGSSIQFDQKVIGKFSRIRRQIDILIESKTEKQNQIIVVDCKFFSKKIDVKLVESFSSMVSDIGANQGILITNKGYSKAAINRAHHGNENIELDILNFETIRKFQGYIALPFVDHHAVSLLAPFGWIVDLENPINKFAILHQRGITFKEAMKRGEWMYVNFWLKNNEDVTLDNLIKIQNENLKEHYKVVFKYLPGAIRSDNIKSKIRIADIDSNTSLEVTGFLEFEDIIFFIVLFTPKESLKKNLRKLDYILAMSTLLNINFDNSKVIEQLLEKSKKMLGGEERANIFHQIADYYKEMLDIDNALTYYKKSIGSFPGHYSSLRGIIFELVKLKKYKEAENYAKKLFESAPTNPIVFSTLLAIYKENNRADLLEVFLEKLMFQTETEEVMGNIAFHQGQLAIFENKDALKYFQNAKMYFEKCFPSNHQVFEVLKEQLDKST